MEKEKKDLRIELVKNKREIIFGVAGVVLLIVVAFLFVGAIRFLVAQVEEALDVHTLGENSMRFDISGLERLGVTPSSSPRISP